MNASTLIAGARLLVGMSCFFLRSSAIGADLRTPQFKWLDQYGQISISEMNSKCDLILIGTVKLPSDTLSNYLVTEICVHTVIASRQIFHSSPVEGTPNSGSLTNLFVYQEWPFEYPDKLGTILLSGGTYLIWLSKTTNLLSTATNTASKFLRPHTAPAYSLTKGAKSVYLLIDPAKLQKKLDLRATPYPWQGELLMDYIGKNDITLFKSITIQIAAALRADRDSTKELAILAKNRSNPQLAKIAQEHLTKGVTNSFIYVNPAPIP